MNVLLNCFVRKNTFVTREVAGETIIVPVRSHASDLDSIYTLNELGTMIWKLIDGKTRVGQIVEAICEAYDVAPEKATEDVGDFLSSLGAAGLIDPEAA